MLEELNNIDEAIRILTDLRMGLAAGALLPWRTVDHAIAYLNQRYAQLYKGADVLTKHVADALAVAGRVA